LADDDAEVLEAHPVDALVNRRNELDARDRSSVEDIERLEQLRVLWHGYRIAVAVSKSEIPPGVDTPEDLEAVRKILR